MVVVGDSYTGQDLIIQIVDGLVTRRARVGERLANRINDGGRFYLIRVIQLQGVRPRVFPLSTIHGNSRPPSRFLLLSDKYVKGRARIFIQRVRICRVNYAVINGLPRRRHRFQRFSMDTRALFTLCHAHCIRLMINNLFHRSDHPDIRATCLLPFRFP